MISFSKSACDDFALDQVVRLSAHRSLTPLQLASPTVAPPKSRVDRWWGNAAALRSWQREKSLAKSIANGANSIRVSWQTAATQLGPISAEAKGGRDNSRSVLARSKHDRRRRILIKGGIVMSMDRAVGDYMKADVLVEGSKIKAVGPNLRASGAIVIDATDMIVMPGFVNTHHHQFQANFKSYYADAYYFASRLMPGYDMSFARGGIVEKYTPEDAYLGEYMGALSSLSHGVTTVCDTSQISLTPQHTDACIAAIKQSGQRSVFAYSSSNPIDTSTYAYPQDIRRLKSQYYSSTDQLMTLALNTGAIPANYALARELGVPIYAHVNSPAAGASVEPLLGSDCTYIHCMGLNASTWQKFVDNGVKVSICAVSEPTVANGIPPLMQVREYGIANRASFSTDTETLISADYFTQMRGAFTVQRLLTLQQSDLGRVATPVPITCREVIEMATMGGAAGAHLADKVGSLTPTAAETLTPTISQRRFTSSISVQSGQMVILGGLISEQTDQAKKRIPIVEKIPYLGDVLGGETLTSKARTELIVFLRPSVISDPADAANLTEAVRASMRSMAPRPAAWDMQMSTGEGRGSVK